jgi:RHS repeat-associated protein
MFIENNYYPFGLKHKGYNGGIIGTDHKYGFGGKEEQDELGLNMLDFGARNYDASLGRWMNLDPLADVQYEFSPYHYAYNSPMMYNDPTGMIGELATNVINEDDPSQTYYVDDGYDFDFYVDTETFNAIKENGGIKGLGVYYRWWFQALGEELKKSDDTSSGDVLQFIIYDDLGDAITYTTDGQYTYAILAIFLGKVKKGKKGGKLIKKLFKFGKKNKLPTPDLNPEQFKPGNKVGEWVHKKTGAIFSKSKTSHGNIGNVGKQWKAWPKGTTEFGTVSKKTGTRITIDLDGNVIGN